MDVDACHGAKIKKVPQRGTFWWRRIILRLYRSLILLALFVAAEASVGQASQTSTDERSHDEEPEVVEGRTACKDGLRDGTGGVHRGVGQRDADEVDEHQGQTDGEAGELTVGMAAVGDTEDDNQEHKGEDSLHDKGATSVDVPVVFATGSEVGAKVIGSEVAWVDVATLHDGID